MDRLLFWVLMPLVAPQALWVRRHAPEVSPARGPDEGSFGSGAPPLSLLAVGDSIVAGVGVDRLEEGLAGRVAAELARLLGREVRWRALGEVGATSEAIRRRLLPLLENRSWDAIVVSAGVNDLTSLRRSAQWSRSLGRLLDELRKHSPGALMAVAGIPPLSHFPLLPQPLRAVIGLRGVTFDRIARAEAARRTGVLHVPVRFDPGPEKFSPDGFHPSRESYREYGAAVASRMAPLLTSGGTRTG